MKKIVVLALLAVAGCEDLPPDRSAEHGDVRRAFDAWTRSLAKGDAPTAWAGMTVGYKSQWLFDLLKDGDSAAHAWRRGLTGETRTTVDLWYNFHKEKNIARVPGMDPLIIETPSVVAIWKGVCDEAGQALKAEMSRLEVVDVYSDGAGATVTVRNIRGTTEMYELVPGRSTWLVNHWVAPRRQVPR